MKRLLPLRRDLGLLLLALYLLFVAPVALAALLFENLASQRLQADVKLADLTLARAIAQETNTIVENALQAVQRMAAYPAVIEADLAGMDPLFAALMSARPDVNLVYRLDARGIMLFHYPIGPGSTVGDDFSFRDYYQGALTTAAPLLSIGRISPTTNQPVATAVMPLRDARGRFLGLVATNIKLQFLSTALSSLVGENQPRSGFQILIIDSAGQIIAHPSPQHLLEDATLTMPAVVAAALQGQSGSLIAPDPAAGETLYSYVPIEQAGWSVIVTRPTALAFATPRAFQRGAFIALAIFLAGGFFFWIALARSGVWERGPGGEGSGTR